MPNHSKWSLYSKSEENNEDRFLLPMKFSNGKSQEDVVNEVLDSIDSGERVIFIKGGCGTGKSAIALNIAKNFKKTSIVVPIKSLQKQYEEDYMNKKYVLKENGEKLKIKVITGRGNHKCKFLEEHQLMKDSQGDNFKLSNYIIDEEKEKFREEDISADNSFLPCKIDINERNRKQIQDYIKQNKNVKFENFDDVKRVRRLVLASVCPYWSPILPSELDINKNPAFAKATIKKYNGINKEYSIYCREKGCSYYEQYQAYSDADVIVYNSLKYQIENVMGRKPLSDIEIIDECDEFLDSFSNSKKINLNLLYFALGSIFGENKNAQRAISELTNLLSKTLKDRDIDETILKQEILHIKETPIFDLLSLFIDYDFMSEVEADEENYTYHCEEVARNFEDFLDDSYVFFYKEGKDLIARIITTNLEKKFKKELLDKNKVIVLMSGTIHSAEVLKKVFGLENFKIIDAETSVIGEVSQLKTGMELNCKYENFANGNITREKYLRALEKSIAVAKKPVLIHVNSFRDLPSEAEAEKYDLCIMTQERIRELQNKYSDNEMIKKFKNKETDVLYSTKSSRGMDFPGEVCNSIILTKYPYPDISSLFWKILKKTNPQNYNAFYIDKSKREFLQRIARGLRFKGDHIYLLSPDIRVFWN